MTAFIVERHWLAVNLILQNISNIIWKGNRYLVHYIYIYIYRERERVVLGMDVWCFLDICKNVFGCPPSS